MTTATAAELEAVWAERVRPNRDQVDLIREVPDRDFYAPGLVAVRRRSAADRRGGARGAAPRSPGRTIAGSTSAPAPAATRCRSRIERRRGDRGRAVARRCANALRTGKAEHGLGEPPDRRRRLAGGLAELGDPPVADVAFIAHVGYDIEEIGPFLDAMDAAASRLCVAMLTDRSPASVADPFWPIVHGMERVPLPALPELAELLRARGRQTEIVRVERAPRTFDSFDGLATFVRRQLWIADDGEKEQRFREALARMAREPTTTAGRSRRRRSARSAS